MVLGSLDQGNRILRKAGSAVARPGMQEFRSDPVVESDAARNFLHVGPHFLGKIGNFVDKSDLRGQKRVGSVLDQLGCTAAGEQNRRTVEIERPVELVHKLARARIGGADDDTVGKLEIADSSAFAEELWVGHDGIVGVGASFADDALNLIARAYGNCRLCYDDGESVEGARDLARSVIDETQICEPVAATRRSADRNEYSIGFGHRTAEFRREF